MQIHFNYRYILDEATDEMHQYLLTQCTDKRIASTIEDVGKVISFAEAKQKAGLYVALYLPYEAAPYFNHQMATVKIEGDYIYAAAYAFNHATDIANYDLEGQILKPCNFKFELPSSQLMTHIKMIQSAIIEGNTYQVNYTTRLTDQIRQPIATLYYTLLQQNHGFYSALIDTDEVKVASLSPELFFQRGAFNNKADVLLSKPMKGTIARGVSEVEDQHNLSTLQQSEKDRAENVMIVDLLRNDMSRIAKTGTVKVYKPFHIEAYSTVFQMTSMVTGELNSSTKLADVLKSLFPCGSITGAPKLNTMQYIKDLEQTPRHVYCGAIGLLLPSGKTIVNVPIRTIQYVNNQAIYGVGAGITIDSIPENEVQEFYDKTKLLERL
ncbi:chorismate-binding protein [Staphylococcus edaphicus]|uniref:Aminodeoxychorismate synthase component I n=1 Tax=Staphylococcus edaphicus TaxID=1955013 RepID=A0A2C6WQH3_9STAP|nr:anthranilate synthase component I family protein [Staphylococcus edaphicus]PHK50383.1 aminodeoxychorismate synthase component I [Staphylococcus edaphicus]UQW81067.1 anthranilate synthase component I family protein [Staphylococcus edaphicus]